MVDYVRRYFWLINLLSIAICAAFAATATGKLVEAQIPPVKRKVRTAPPPMLDPSLQGSSRRDITAILDRNIFCSTCEKVVEKPAEGGDGEGAPSASDSPVKSSLNLKLIATMVSEEDRAWSFAALLDDTEGKTGLFTIGSTVPGDATITDIMERRILLINGGRNEYIDLEGEGQAEATAQKDVSTPVPNSGFRMPTATPGMAEVAAGIRRVGGTSWEIQRSTLNKVLGNTTLLARSARIVPSVRNGEPNGFKLYAIRPGSLYSLLGMFNGDTINAVNGHPITTPDKALEIYTKLRNASHLSISFTRRGQAITHEYDIR